MAIITAKQLAALLEAKGLPTFETHEPNENEDGAVMLTARVHVQVGYDYVNVVRQCGPHEFLFYPPRTGVKALLADVQAAFNN